jgi:hypothetical protein
MRGNITVKLSHYEQMLQHRDRIILDKEWSKGLWFSVALVQQLKTFISNFALDLNGMIVPAKTDHIFIDSPWVFIPYPSDRMHCRVWQKMKDCFGFQPCYCLTSCWKVVFDIPTVKDLFATQRQLEHFCSGTGLHSKCGMDVRDYTRAKYAAFIYATSLEEGRDIHSDLRSHVPPHISVNLKRGCTEMEAMKPSNLWPEPTDDHLRFEAMILSMFGEMPRAGKQSTWMINRIWHAWLMRAKDLQDETWRECVGEEGLSRLVSVGRGYVKSITYQEEE